jgi:hypothetical protein
VDVADQSSTVREARGLRFWAFQSTWRAVLSAGVSCSVRARRRAARAALAALPTYMYVGTLHAAAHATRLVQYKHQSNPERTTQT